jgi:unsaturated rhamnogalacturonyl hydrolase
MVFILFFILSIIVIIDLFPQFYTWQSRIHIGRHATVELWHKRVLAKSKQWLRHTPTITLTDNDRLIVIDIIKGNYKRAAIQSWQEAALLLGLYENYKKTNSGALKKELIHYIDSKIDATGNWKQLPKEIDGVILAYAIMHVDFADHQKNKPAYDAMWQLVQNLVGEDGTVQYRKHMKHYRYVDTIGFICPFLVHYGLHFGNQDALDLGVRQITAFNEYGMYKATFIPCHTYTVQAKLPVGLFGWGRGLGWYAIGLIDSWTALPENHPHKATLTESVVAFATMALQFQNQNGAWHWIVASKEARMDSSTTATLAWFLANAAQHETLHADCTAASNKALDYLKKVTRRDGVVDFSQGDTKAIGVHSQKFGLLPFTQGFVLRTFVLVSSKPK